ncbi:ADP/ATP-dependent (S)-NAD(P)H-hydrate dehydratase [Curtobacterium flaccumfaciens]|nr:ADP/ATP-dependent (S)-NAD(P)H-hydrate dehydratase [Curtobacterium flaccumfaciens]
MNDFVPVRPSDAVAWVTAPTGESTKYRRGVLGIATGSDQYPGAAVLGVDAAVHTGVGMVRHVGPSRATDHVLTRRPEVVSGGGRVQAWLVGSGISAPSLGDLDEATASGFSHASDDGVPVVVDAGAIPLVDLGPLAVLTPHAGELASFLGADRADIEQDPAAAALRAAERVRQRRAAQGERTHVVTPDGSVRLVASSATPWLAAAGAGDVLGGVLGGTRRRAAGRRRGCRFVAHAVGPRAPGCVGRGGARARGATGVRRRAVPDDDAHRRAARGRPGPRRGRGCARVAVGARAPSDDPRGDRRVFCRRMRTQWVPAVTSRA